MNIGPSQGIKTVPQDRSVLMSILKGILVSYIITIPIFMALAFILTYTDFPNKFVNPAVFITTVLSILIAGISSTRKMKSKGWFNGAVVGFTYMTVLYLLSSIVYRDFSIDKHMVSMIVLSVVTGAIGGIVGINTKKESTPRGKR
ncbi:MAG: TIGR04086 family membrane protein [Clostridia bacterium]|nr:TIGR04086 family membrane protein [Clostridia bacterium]